MTDQPKISYFHLALAALSLVAMPLALAIRADWPLWIVIVLGTPPLLGDILRGLLKGDFGADILAALGLATAIILSETMAATLVILMLASGQALEAYALRRASSAFLALAGRMPATAHRRRDGHIEEVPLEAIAIGDEIVLYPHETAPVDGTILSGHGSMDESYLTGEPYRVSKAPGASVLSGAINGEAALVIHADRLAQDSRYAAIMKVMQEAEQKRPALRRLADQIGAVFTPVALLLAITAWVISGEVMRFLAVLVVATPCPLIIAIPVALISAISRAAQRGIVIRDPTVLERLPTCRTAIFDKTGTLTYGRPELTEILTAPGINDEKILRLSAALERYSKHPLALAILEAAAKEKLYLPDAQEVSEKPGQGLTGRIEGHALRVTSRKKLLLEQPGLESVLPPTAPGLECLILLDNAYAATLRFRDTPRAEGKPFIHHLGPNHHFSKVMLVSGDRESEVNYLADLLGITDIHAAQSPEQKLALVREESAHAATLFMGDGINDAPALAAATVGLAFGQHSSVTSEAAGAVIMDNTLSRVDELIHLSEDMRRIALQSAWGGMALSVIGMLAAAFGYLTPVEGALAQEAIDVLAILGALRLAFDRDLKPDV